MRIVEHLLREKLPYRDEARAYDKTPWTLLSEREPFPHQTEALETWWKQRGRGVVVLPTGTGKTHVAILAIHRVARPALIVTPTIDLMHQWHGELTTAFGGTVGVMGGGEYNIQPLTVTTYDSAHIHLDRWGNKFGLLVFDECHHLPGPSYKFAAIGTTGPVAARSDRDAGTGRRHLESLLPELIGPIVYRKEIKELSGDYLAQYHVQKVFVDLTPEEAKQYQEARDRYRNFVTKAGISMGSPTGWKRFLQETYRSPEGRAAFLAYREQKRISQAAPAKIRELENLLERHRADRTLIFTADNATVYQIARKFLVPAITHQTKSKERRTMLERFHFRRILRSW